MFRRNQTTNIQDKQNQTAITPNVKNCYYIQTRVVRAFEIRDFAELNFFNFCEFFHFLYRNDTEISRKNCGAMSASVLSMPSSVRSLVLLVIESQAMVEFVAIML